MTQYRIKVQTSADGRQAFIPEEKGWFFWRHFPTSVHAEGAYGEIAFSTESQARKYLQERVDMLHAIRQARIVDETYLPFESNV